ncbi:hypothetical protein [Methylocucumis oryzae]|uniref:Uncharacterized protein n=1 Tax=Methylocucumis oryzae TaxID=1632867 RepID=A0A0F3IJK0_9GAMM|nr:hypothetical protein [Methylocucumis oryzae]KJV06950.1 hypothetical protein VZ94_08045 [Methylocucumis oryzae]
MYAPRDFNSDDGFLKALQEKSEARPELKELDKQIEEKIKSVLTSDKLLSSANNKPELQESLIKAAEKITNEIRKSSFITVDARSFTGSDDDLYEFQASAFSSLNDLTDEIYFQINKLVKPYEYGHTWVIKDKATDAIIKNARMITGTKPGIPLPDGRALWEVGIKPGMTFEVVRPK